MEIQCASMASNDCIIRFQSVQFSFCQRIPVFREQTLGCRDSGKRICDSQAKSGLDGDGKNRAFVYLLRGGLVRNQRCALSRRKL